MADVTIGQVDQTPEGAWSCWGYEYIGGQMHRDIYLGTVKSKRDAESIIRDSYRKAVRAQTDSQLAEIFGEGLRIGV